MKQIIGLIKVIGDSVACLEIERRQELIVVTYLRPVFFQNA